jgi:hypothetical protein
MLSLLRTAPRVVACLSLIVASGFPAMAAVADPAGDVFGAGPVRPDIISTDASFNSFNLTFTVMFGGNISPASAFAPDSILGFIDVDTDQNPLTGAAPWINAFIPALVPGPPVSLGDEYFVDLGSEMLHAGFVDIVDALTSNTAGTVPIAFSATSFSIDIPLSVLGNDDGLLNYAVLIGTFNEPTDRAPNGDTPLVSVDPPSVPEPGTLSLAGIALGSLLLAAKRRRASR